MPLQEQTAKGDSIKQRQPERGPSLAGAKGRRRAVISAASSSRAEPLGSARLVPGRQALQAPDRPAVGRTEPANAETVAVAPERPSDEPEEDKKNGSERPHQQARDNSTARDQPPGGRHAPEQDRPGHFAPMKEPRHLTPAFFLDPPGVTSAQAGSSQDSPEEQFALPLH